MDTVKELFNHDGEIIGLKEVCEWWLETYPEDVFVHEPVDVIDIRDRMKKILSKLIFKVK